MGTRCGLGAATATIINMLGREIGVSYEMGAFIACAVFIIYTATSGLFGVIYTDVFQFVMLILFVYILIPGASLVKLGGPAAFFRNHFWKMATPYVDSTIIGDIITHFVFHARGRGDVATRLCGEKSQKAGKKNRASFRGPWHTGLRSLSCGSWASRTSLSARKRSPCTEPPTPLFRRLPLRSCL